MTEQEVRQAIRDSIKTKELPEEFKKNFEEASVNLWKQGRISFEMADGKLNMCSTHQSN